MPGPMALPPNIANQVNAHAHLQASLAQFRLALAKDTQMLLLSHSLRSEPEFQGAQHQDDLREDAVLMAKRAVAHTDALMAALGFEVRKVTEDGELSDAL